MRGGFPLSYLAKGDADSLAFLKNFILTLLERDLPQWGVRVPATALRRFWTILARSGEDTWNAAEAAQSVGRQRVDSPGVIWTSSQTHS